jgi:hypothetical protein
MADEGTMVLVAENPKIPLITVSRRRRGRGPGPDRGPCGLGLEQFRTGGKLSGRGRENERR